MLSDAVRVCLWQSSYDNVRTVVLGGIDSAVPQSYRSFPGLQVMDSDSLYSVSWFVAREFFVCVYPHVLRSA